MTRPLPRQPALLAAALGGALMAVGAADAAAAAGQARLGCVKAERVLFLGNSITLHGPAEQIGWSGNWGMAASSAEKDYVHLLLQLLSEAAGRKPEAMIRNIADFERGYRTYDPGSALKKELDFGADLAIVAIGENVPALASEEAKQTFKNSVSNLLATLKKSGPSAIFARSCFWPDNAKDDAMRQACQEAGATFVDISGLSRDESHYARSERRFAHAGVAAHPGDKGMKAIADALWKAMNQ